MNIPFQHSYAELGEEFARPVAPTPVAEPRLVWVNDGLAVELGLDAEWLRSAEGLEMLSGNGVPAPARPVAQAYAGHQFANFVPQLGDGRAILLGELAGQDVVLKGAGRTPFSRGGDGRSALGPCLREALVSEAMHALGVPTTRALAVVETGEAVHRQYGPEPGGIMTRVASSHVRVGTFQFFAARGEVASVKRLAEYVMRRNYGEVSEYTEFLVNVVRRQAELVAHWMSLGFIHGVMNTDNCAIAGETIDYGPCAFVDDFHPHCVYSAIDVQGRYAWAKQAEIAQWNVTRLAECLLPFLSEDLAKAKDMATAALAEFAPTFQAAYLGRFRAKFGIVGGADSFVDESLSEMANHKADFTQFFRQLTSIADGEGSDLGADWGDWLARWRAQGEIDLSRMERANPVLIPRNHRVEEAIRAGYEGDYEVFERLMAAWAQPFENKSLFSDLQRPPTSRERVTETFCGT